MKHSRITPILACSALLFCAASYSMADDTKKDKGTQTAPTGKDKAEHKDKADHKDNKKVKVGDKVSNFTMTDASGKSLQFSDFAGKTVVLEWCNPECPVCQAVTKGGLVTKMITDAKAIDPNVVFVMVNSTAKTAGDPKSTTSYLEANKVSTNAVVIDGSGVIGKMFDAKTTPHMFVIDSKGTLVYSGAFDDSADNGQTPGKTNYVLNALTQLKEGKAVSPSETKAYGCGVKYGSEKAEKKG
ncbi:MAG: redoxin family protein [Planctomycetes bacterium]|nr:redoxin family protein [Planctomycetota bacterium]